MGIHQWVDVESLRFEGAAELGDKRRTARLQNSLVDISLAPNLSFPRIFRDEASREGFYRFVESPSVEWRKILEPHSNRTLERCGEVENVLVLHDTTDVSFQLYDPELIKTHMSRLSTKKQGFHAHVSIAVTDDGGGLPLGTLEFQPYVHKRNMACNQGVDFWNNLGGIYDNERKRWFDLIQDAETSIRESSASCIHVMDREADSYPMFAWLQQEEIHYVARVSEMRRQLVGTSLTVSEALSTEDFIAEAKVFIGARGPLRSPKEMKARPSRKARIATLQFRAKEVTIKVPRKSTGTYTKIPHNELPETLTLNLVEAIEPDPPAGETAVRWLLYTSEPIATAADVIRVIEIYRKRWIIEEFFKALKSGCSLEQRQMDSASAVLNVFTLLLPIAWRLLLMRSLDDVDPKASWRLILDPLAFHILCKAVPEKRLRKTAKVGQVILAIASLGGHIRQNGAPGWQTIYRGWSRLSEYVEGAELAAAFSNIVPK